MEREMRICHQCQETLNIVGPSGRGVFEQRGVIFFIRQLALNKPFPGQDGQVHYAYHAAELDSESVSKHPHHPENAFLGIPSNVIPAHNFEANVLTRIS